MKARTAEFYESRFSVPAGTGIRIRFPSLAVVGLLLLLVCGGGPARGELLSPPGDRQAEYAVKAAFLFNFIKFVDWPDGRFPPEGEPIQVCILGRDPFGDILDSIEERTAQNRPLRLTRDPTSEDLDRCHVLFISSSEEFRLAQILKDLEARGILTVGDMADFARRGGVIGFALRNNRVGLDVNLDAAERAQLKISAKVLELAQVVR